MATLDQRGWHRNSDGRSRRRQSGGDLRDPRRPGRPRRVKRSRTDKSRDAGSQLACPRGRRQINGLGTRNETTGRPGHNWRGTGQHLSHLPWHSPTAAPCWLVDVAPTGRQRRPIPCERKGASGLRATTVEDRRNRPARFLVRFSGFPFGTGSVGRGGSVDHGGGAAPDAPIRHDIG